MTVVECKNVSIRYKTGDLKSIGLKDYVIQKLSGKYKVQEFWADKNISFSLEKGDMLGIVGTNGAGKSTLLKAVTGIMVPTEGQVITRGNIAALLELASGFDPELTVRENTFLRGALLGYTKKFIEEKYDEIIAFAELEAFQNHMFKQLSSGMKSRLAFSIACLVNPDILILDEVLSVGDEAFKDKSAQRIKNILANGVTGMLVSHSVYQVRTLCNKCLWLDHGKQVAFGPSDPICDAYSTFLCTPREKRILPANNDELYKISHRFRIAWRLGEKERAAHTNPPKESETDRVYRLLTAVDAMTPEEKAIIENELNAKKEGTTEK